MEKKLTLKRLMYILGVIAFIIGALDPLEGSVLIFAGSVFIALSTYLQKDKHWKLFLTIAILISFGVFFLFYLSSLGGFGGTSELSWWWGLLIIPYPIGWLFGIVLLITRAIKNKKTPKI